MRFRRAAVLCAIALTVSCSGGDGANGDGLRDAAPSDATTTSTTAPGPLPLPEPALEDRDCDPDRVAEVADGIEFECHWLLVPANRTIFDGSMLRLSVTVLHSRAAEPLPDALVYLSGGPGGSGGTPRYWSQTPFIEDRDVIVYDQRGTGESEPTMECPEMEQAVLEAFGDAGSYEDELAVVQDAVTACRDRLVDDGVDLAGFSTPESAADLDDLRRALGYETWNLLGVSYGSRLAQEALRSHPEGIRSVVLDSTYPMDEGAVYETVDGAQRALDVLADGCAADAACAAAHGDLRVAVDEIVERYDAEPHRSTIDLGEDAGGEIDIAITGTDIVAGLFTAMYDSELIKVLPTFATELREGRSALIDQVAIQGIPRANGLAEGMALSTNCNDSAPMRRATPDVDAELLADPGRWASLVTVFSPSFCDLWLPEDAPGVPDAFAEPVRSTLPVLVLSGTYDPVTTTPEAERVAAELPNGVFVTFDGLGHGIWNEVECATDIVLNYLADPAQELDVSCAADVGPPAFG